VPSGLAEARRNIGYYFHVIDAEAANGEPARGIPETELMANNDTRVAVVEDEREIREGLAFLIGSSPGFQCVATCASAEDALRDVPPSQADVVLMDIQLPGMSGIECIRELKLKMPSIEIMMLTVFEDHDKIFQSLLGGASGYLVKKTPPAKLLEAIQELRNGGAPMSNQIARRVVQTFQQTNAAKPVLTYLSGREQEILNLLAKGFLYKEIADQLGISIETVRTHIRHIYDKLHVRSRTEAILKASPR